MKKVHSGPIDTFMYYLSEQVADVLHSFKVTPNMVTILGTVLIPIIYKLLRRGNKKLAIGLMLFRYFLDNLDGFMARRFKEFSIFGDYLDHISDNLFTASILYYMYHHDSFDLFKKKMMIYLLFVFLMNIHLGCQEKIADYNAPSLSCTKMLCLDVSWVEFTKYVEPGTAFIALCALVWY